MSEFEEYIKVNYPRDYERQKRIYPDQRVEELYSEDYKMWQHQQAIIDDLKAQLNNMEACYIEKKKQVEECAALAAGWNEIAWDKATHWTEGYEEGCYHCSAQIEEALRGERE
ncbi:hypothetical protein GQO11_02460 [Acinetobacter johnsonii]|uniref:hypothetical protein n=1 Tax=Acinetobacter johnsonii TaxID=40214 RepID=UPI001322C510|nr:hypothetical protein [Acinetobacter johnsonii]MWC17548.1 hypothetical protein [Acinetobacter johnsonii]